MVLISGGAGGIGRASALAFCRAGAPVALADIDEAAGRQALAELQAAGFKALFVPTDVTDEAAVQQAVAATVQRFGKLDGLFNCAGGSIPQDAPVHEVPWSVWEHTVNLDLKGTVLMCRHAIPALIAAGGGTVVNMSSGAALRGSSRSHIYSATKGAVVSLTRVLAGTYARHNIRVNAICSGRVNTERVRNSYGVPGHAGQFDDPMNGNLQVQQYPFWLGEPEDIAAIALFLLSHESRMITGAALAADGGRSAY